MVSMKKLQISRLADALKRGGIQAWACLGAALDRRCGHEVSADGSVRGGAETGREEQQRNAEQGQQQLDGFAHVDLPFLKIHYKSINLLQLLYRVGPGDDKTQTEQKRRSNFWRPPQAHKMWKFRRLRPGFPGIFCVVKMTKNYNLFHFSCFFLIFPEKTKLFSSLCKLKASDSRCFHHFTDAFLLFFRIVPHLMGKTISCHCTVT